MKNSSRKKRNWKTKIGPTLSAVSKGISTAYHELDSAKKEVKAWKTAAEIQKSRPTTAAVYDALSLIRRRTGCLSDFEDTFHYNSSTMGIILGARGKGKTALGMKLLENQSAKSDTQACSFGVPLKRLPTWIKAINSLEDISPNSTLLIDEAGVQFSSRDSMSENNKTLSSIILTARHNDVSIIFISQNSSNLDINILRQADYLVLKPSALLQMNFERNKIRDKYRELDQEFKELSSVVGLAYIYSDGFCGFVSNPLPTFWSESISKSHRKP